MRNVEPIGEEMNVRVIEPALGSIGGQLDVTEQAKRHRCKLPASGHAHVPSRFAGA
ncbi:MAG: hypothetical protein WBW74_07525 [Xanthobacteraceae bacterium]